MVTVRGVREVFLRDRGGPTRRVVWRVCLVPNGDGRRAGGERENAKTEGRGGETGAARGKGWFVTSLKGLLMGSSISVLT